jgi:hypothetical protein
MVYMLIRSQLCKDSTFYTGELTSPDDFWVEKSEAQFVLKMFLSNIKIYAHTHAKGEVSDR